MEVHPDREVKDLAAHLLHGSLRRITALRDGYRRPTPPIVDTNSLIAFIQEDNRNFMRGMRRISPQILTELITTRHPRLCLGAGRRNETLTKEFDMDHEEVGRYWNANAEAWTTLARAGYDVYRDYLNTPAFFAMLPGVKDLSGLDIGCGEGHNTRLLAQRGAKVTAIDIAEDFITYARQAEAAEPLGIAYRVASALTLPFPDLTFDFVTGFMSFMDIPDTERVVAEAHRVLKPGGFLQFSILHPCFNTPHRRNLRYAQRQTYAIEVGDYFRNRNGEIEQWLFSTLPREIKQKIPPFKIPLFTRTVSQWLNLLIEMGFVIERVAEPQPSDATVRACPAIQDAQVIAYFLHLRVRKP